MWLHRCAVFDSGKDYTSTYGSTQFDGNLTPRIHSHLKSVRNCILDGEMCGYDPELQVLGMSDYYCRFYLLLTANRVFIKTCAVTFVN